MAICSNQVQRCFVDFYGVNSCTCLKKNLQFIIQYLARLLFDVNLQVTASFVGSEGWSLKWVSSPFLNTFPLLHVDVCQWPLKQIVSQVAHIYLSLSIYWSTPRNTEAWTPRRHAPGRRCGHSYSPPPPHTHGMFKKK